MTITLSTGRRVRGGAFLHRSLDLLRTWRSPAGPTSEQNLVRAMCHDMVTPLASLRALLQHVPDSTEGSYDQAVHLARAQADHLISLLRTATATGGAAAPTGWPRPLSEIVLASLAASGLPAHQVHLDLDTGSLRLQVADARVQRILVNLLENAHRHGAGHPVYLAVRTDPGRVRLCLTQQGVPDRVAAHVSTRIPPCDLTGLGLWSAQRQAAELHGHVACTAVAEGTCITVDLPDR